MSKKPDYSNCKRVWLKRPGQTTRNMLIVAPPFPKKGDVLTFKGVDWEVARIKDEKIFAAFDTSEKGKLRQVFP